MACSLPAVRLVSLSDAERREFLEAEVARYAESKSRAGGWPGEDPRVRAREEIEAVLGRGADARGHRFLKGVDAAGRDIGRVWVGPVPRAEDDSRARWLFQILVDETLRGRGYGRAILHATEEFLRTEGVGWLRLNVWLWNEAAIRLYESVGYDIVSRDSTGFEMCKRILDG